MEYFDLWDSCMIKSLKLLKSGNQLQFLIQRVPSGRTSNALSIPRRFSALTFFLSLLYFGLRGFVMLPNFGVMHHSKRQNLRFLLVMLRLELHITSVLAVGKLTLGLLPRYTSCFSSSRTTLICKETFQFNPGDLVGLLYPNSGDIVDLIGNEDPTDEDGDTEVSMSLGEISSKGKKSWESDIGDCDNTVHTRS
nr:hypothetical protein [Tanacetum cinerariifolium]